MTTVEEIDRQWAELKQADKEAKAANTIVGRYVEHNYADSYAVYKIVGCTRQTVRVEHVAIGDAWVLPAWGTHATVPLRTIRSLLNQRDAFETIALNDRDWWASQGLGSVVHYDNSFDQFVRGVIVVHEGQKVMRCTALVGTGWKKHDLCSRSGDGSIVYGTFARLVVEGGYLQPNPQNMVEYPRYVLRYADPRYREAVSLAVPVMTTIEIERAALVRRRNSVVEALAVQVTNNPTSDIQAFRHALAAAKTLLEKQS